MALEYFGPRYGACGNLARSRFAEMRDPARHRRHHPRSRAVAAAGLGAAGPAAHAGAARRPDRRRAGAGLRPLAQRHRSDLFAAAARRDRRPRRRNARRGRRRADHARDAAERRAQAQARQHHRARPRHSRRGQGLFARLALSAGARQGRRACARRSTRFAPAPPRHRRDPARQAGRRDQAGRRQQGRMRCAN